MSVSGRIPDSLSRGAEGRELTLSGIPAYFFILGGFQKGQA
jgi:hypothetical protein